MIKIIVAVDSKMGIANESGIPWHVDQDKLYYREKIKDSNVLMGRVTYDEQKQPVSSGNNYVLTHLDSLRPGFIKVNQIDELMRRADDIWIIGGENIYKQTLDFAEQIFITRIEGDYKCTKFFPEFEEDFTLSASTETNVENGIKFRFEIYNRK
jgi:dihydrofolate reductase